jgi:hypothetical protein
MIRPVVDVSASNRSFALSGPYMHRTVATRGLATSSSDLSSEGDERRSGRGCA